MLILDDIKVVTFDWGDTIAYSNGLPHSRNNLLATNILLRRCANILKFEISTESIGHISRKFVEEFDASYKISIDLNGNSTGAELDLNAIVFDFVCRVFGLSSFNENIADAIKAYFIDMVSIITPMPGAIEIFSNLHAKGIRLGILSHSPVPLDVCRCWFYRYGFADYISFYSISSDIGWIKPHPLHFSHAEKLAGCKKSEIIHVGDHPIRDILGAERYGFYTILIKIPEMYPPNLINQCSPTFTANSLADVLEIFRYGSNITPP